VSSATERLADRTIGLALVVGIVVAIPVALLAYVTPSVARALRSGAGAVETLGAAVITDEEDWELMPMYLLGALVVGALTALVAVLVWLVLDARGSTRAARIVAAVAAAAVPLTSLLMISSWALVVVPSTAAGLLSFALLPWVRRRSRATHVVRVRDVEPDLLR